MEKGLCALQVFGIEDKPAPGVRFSRRCSAGDGRTAGAGFVFDARVDGAFDVCRSSGLCQDLLAAYSANRIAPSDRRKPNHFHALFGGTTLSLAFLARTSRLTFVSITKGPANVDASSTNKTGVMSACDIVMPTLRTG